MADAAQHLQRMPLQHALACSPSSSETSTNDQSNKMARGLRRAMPETAAKAVPTAAAAATRKRARAADDATYKEEEVKEDGGARKKRTTTRTSGAASGAASGATSGAASGATSGAASGATSGAASGAAPAVLTAGYNGRRTLPAAAVTFLRDLAANNEREWFKAHQTRYDAARESFLELLKGVTVHLERLDADVGPQDPKLCMFRIFRDVRFSNDKTPYKTCLSAAMARGGRKSAHACYYLHLQPGGASFVGGGMYMPDAGMLRLLREAIAQGAGAELRQVVGAAAFQRHFGPAGIFGDHADRLKTAPKGFAKDHPYIDILQLKSFVTGRKISDELLTSPALLETIVDAFAAMVPFVHLLNSLTGLV